MGDGAKAAASAWPAVQTLPKSSPSSITSQWPPSGVESGGPRSQRPLQGERALGWVRGSGVQVWSLSIPAHHLSPETAWRHFPVAGNHVSCTHYPISSVDGQYLQWEHKGNFNTIWGNRHTCKSYRVLNDQIECLINVTSY